MRETDLDEVAALADLVFPGHHEDRRFFAERLRLGPATCFVLRDPEDRLEGYLVAYFWRLGVVPPLNAPTGTTSGAPDCVYIHDLALTPEASGRGLATAILRELSDRALARGVSRLALVSVNASAAFWERSGFSGDSWGDAMLDKRSAYGEDARYMVRDLRVGGRAEATVTITN
ncbi:GNAT family N-acetyltransferase [Methylobacterium radiodurans]|nr:GNAT family N-acetyltransferase [Methylobacterium radiodurans]